MTSPVKRSVILAAPRAWHQMEAGEALAQLAVNPGEGLADRESARRLEEIGANQLMAAEKIPWWRMLLAQFQDFMVLVLIAATVLSYAMGETADAITIVVIVVINAVLGFVQEFRAERSLEALKQMAAPTAQIRRAGHEMQVAAADLVPGDILLLEAGDKVPADARLLEGMGLEAEEAALTGESLPVRKSQDWIGTSETGLGDRRNMLYMGTSISRGRGIALVVETGMSTEMGKIAGLMQEVEVEETPLQKRLAQLGKWLVVICLGVCALVVVAGLLAADDLTSAEVSRLFMAGISLAVAAIPEGLPTIVTVALALGVQRMIKRNAIVRKLQAVETLGCATVICSDKTGTLTKNEMMVRAAWAGGRRYGVTGDGYRPTGEFLWEGSAIRPLEDPALALTVKAAALCSNTRLVQAGRAKRNGSGPKGAAPGTWTIQGDPTEGALVVAASKAGYRLDRLHKGYRRLLEIPFESERRCMSVITRSETGEVNLYAKGAPDTIVELSTHIYREGKLQPMTPELRRQIITENERMADQALRVLGIAFRPLPADFVCPSGEESNPDQAAAQWEHSLVFLGLLGMIDPPRLEVKKAVQTATRAGIRTVMITGDHPATALAVARELSIAGPEGRAATGRELDQMTDEDLIDAVRHVRVFARVSPQHKLRIVRAFKALGEIVAMTGDGVNDAPAVKEADIGIAMGRTGTDVTKEASAIILSDDNFATIIAAVEEGRGIYDNIRKFIRYLLSCNTGEVLTMFLAALMKLPLPLLPIQILFVNLVTDGLPAMALGVEKTESDVMRRGPRHPEEGIFARRLGFKILGRGVLIGLGTLGAFLTGVMLGVPALGVAPLRDPAILETARTMALATLVCAQLIHVFDCRSERRSIFESGLFGNKWLVGAVASSMTALVLSIYWTPMASVFGTATLDLREWLVVLGFAGLGEILVALRRFLLFGRPVRVAQGIEEEA